MIKRRANIKPDDFKLLKRKFEREGMSIKKEAELLIPIEEFTEPKYNTRGMYRPMTLKKAHYLTGERIA